MEGGKAVLPDEEHFLETVETHGAANPTHLKGAGMRLAGACTGMKGSPGCAEEPRRLAVRQGNAVFELSGRSTISLLQKSSTPGILPLETRNTTGSHLRIQAAVWPYLELRYIGHPSNSEFCLPLHLEC